MIYFHNPSYYTHYGHNLYYRLTGRFSHRKYWFLAKHVLGEKEDAAVFLDLDVNSFDSFFFYKFRPLNRLVTRLENFLWLLTNGINPLRVRTVTDPAALKQGDALITFGYDHLDSENRMPWLKGVKAVKIDHLSHYMCGTSSVSRNCLENGVDYFAAENELNSASAYFRAHFPWYKKPVYLLPYVFQERFVNTRPFGERLNRCFAMGTFDLLPDNAKMHDFITFFDSRTIQPMRKAIYERRGELAGLVDSFISNIREEIKYRPIKPGDGALAKLYSAAYNIVKARQSKYFKDFDSVQKLNEYRMFVVPEELSGYPGISAIEGMACGCAFIGIDDPMYRNIGLVPGVHYIAYDNTLEGLLDAVRRCQADPAMTERVAAAGCAYVRENFNGRRVAEVFYSDMKRMLAARAAGKDAFESSFLRPGEAA